MEQATSSRHDCNDVMNRAIYMSTICDYAKGPEEGEEQP